MKTIAFITQKGGAGKTTLAASLAVAAEEAGEKVALLDLDPQLSLTGWADTRESEKPAFDTLGVSQVSDLPNILPKIEGQGFTLVILDTAGVDSVGTRLAMENADISIIPSRPTTMDIRATKVTHDAAVKLGKRFVFVLNQCPPQPNNPRAQEAAAGLNLWGVLAQPLMMQRAAHQDAFAAGLGVTEYDPESKAADEVRNLWGWIKEDMEGKTDGKTKKNRLVG